MTSKKDLTDRLIITFRNSLFNLALAAKRGDACAVVVAKIKMHHLWNEIVPGALGWGTKSHDKFRKLALEILEEERKTKKELITELQL